MPQANSQTDAPQHTSRNLRCTNYKWNKTADLVLRAMEVVSGEREEFGFLGIPLAEQAEPTTGASRTWYALLNKHPKMQNDDSNQYNYLY
jgi:hypothetical protein